VRTALAAVLSLLLPAAALAGPPFVAFRFGDGPLFRMGGVSNDGRSVVYTADTPDFNRTVPTLWRPVTDARPARTMLGGSAFSGRLPAISPDGDRLGGIGDGQGTIYDGSGAVLHIVGQDLFINAITSDGLAAAGEAGSGDPFLWTLAGGVESLASISPFNTPDRPRAMSEDATIIVGAGFGSDLFPVPVRWDASGGAPLPRPTGASEAEAVDITPDGSLVLIDSDIGAFLWNQTTGYTPIPLAGASSMSDDASVIVGGGMIWTADDGARTPDLVFAEAFGFDPTEYTSLEALAVSADGRAFAGRGQLAGSSTNLLWSARLPDPVADVTTTGATLEGQAGYGEPDGNIDLDDLGFFLNLWLAG